MPKKLHLELTDKCNAKCPMCTRTSPHGLGDSHLVKNVELTYEDICSIETKFERVNYCGNHGDPLLAKDFLKIVKHFEGAFQTIHTNGSLRSEEFWKELASVPNIEVTFGIDGSTQEIHEFYRRATNLDKILNNAKTFIDAGGKAIWQMIIFHHNEDDVEKCRELSKQWGFQEFESLHTRRFYLEDKFDYEYKGHKYVLEKSTYSPFKRLNPEKKYEYEIICSAKNDEEIYISADGQVWPCCYLPKHNELNRNEKAYNIKCRPLEEIVFDDYFDDVANTFEDKPMLMCALTCGISHKNIRNRVINIKPL